MSSNVGWLIPGGGGGGVGPPGPTGPPGDRYKTFTNNGINVFVGAQKVKKMIVNKSIAIVFFYLSNLFH
jgi:hypothetical protein